MLTMFQSKDANVLDDEPTLGLGVGAALMLVQKKGMLLVLRKMLEENDDQDCAREIQRL